jgi:hypothetical protein
MSCCGHYHPPLRYVRRLREAVGDDDLDIGLNLDDGSDDDNEHGPHLAAAAKAIFSNTRLSAEEKLTKLRLLLKIDGDDEDDQDAEDGEDLPRELRGQDVPECLRSTWRKFRRRPPASRADYDPFPGLTALGGGLSLISEARRPRKTGRLTTARFLEAIQRGR